MEGTIQSPGISSGIDVNTLVARLVAVERAPTELRLNRLERRIDTQVSALGNLKGALSSLLSSLSGLKSQSDFQTRSSQSSDESVLTATTTSAAVTGSYGIEVLAIAQAHKLRSAEIAGGASANVGTGTLTIAVGAESFDIEIDDSNKSLSGIRDAINAAPNNKGVRAALINTAGGAVLTLSSNDTGASKAMRVTQTGGDGGLATLVYDPGVQTNLVEMIAAQDASVRIEGFAVSSATNSLAGAIDGVTLNLQSAAPGTTVTLSVSNDTDTSVERAKKFVTDFNVVATAVLQLRRYNPTTREAGPLLGDSMLRGVEATLRGMLSSTVSNGTPPYDTLSSIGITTQADGTLKLDETRLKTALNVSFDAVGKVFGAADGIAARMHSYLDEQLKSDAPIASRTESLGLQKRSIERDRASLDRRLDAVEARYRTQFSSLDTLLAGLQQTSAFLAQRLGS